MGLVVIVYVAVYLCLSVSDLRVVLGLFSDAK